MLYELTVTDGDNGWTMPGGELTLFFASIERAFAQAVPWIEQGYTVKIRGVEEDA